MEKSSQNRSHCRMLMRSMLVALAFLLCAGSAYAQRLTLNHQKTPLLTVLKEIQQKTSYTFVYNNSLIDVNKEVSIMSSNEDMTAVLDRLFASAGISYQIIDKQISLSPAVFPQNTAAQNVGQSTVQRKISFQGTVLDEEGNPLPGALVAVKGNARKSAFANNDGKFE